MLTLRRFACSCCCAAALAACSKSSNTAASDTTAMNGAAMSTPAGSTAVAPAAAPAVGPTAGPIDMKVLASHKGTWQGQSMPMNKDTVVDRWRIVSTADTTGWTETDVAPKPGKTVPVHVLAAGGDSISIQFLSPNNANPSTTDTVRGTAHYQGDKMTATYVVVFSAHPDSVMHGRATATRVH